MQATQRFSIRLAISLGLRVSAHAGTSLSDTARIQALTGMQGAWNAKEAVYKVSSPAPTWP